MVSARTTDKKGAAASGRTTDKKWCGDLTKSKKNIKI